VEAGIGLGGSDDADSRREHCVQRASQRGHVDAMVQPGARHLAERVDARVGPSRPDNGHARALDAGQRLLDERLDRNAAALPLPPDEVRAVVRQRQLQRPQRAHGHLDPLICIEEPDSESAPSCGACPAIDDPPDNSELWPSVYDPASWPWPFRTGTGREPGFVMAMPCAQSGHWAGS
jgi:hypothetical protein